jgi:cysteine desulfurase
MQEALEQRDAISLEMARLRYNFECRIKQVVPDAIIFYESSAKLPNCSVIGFPCVNNEALLYALNRNGVFASFGGGFHQQLSYILTASGIDEITANTALHFSLSRYTTDEEVEHAVEIILQAVKSLRKVSAQLFRSS